ncbi:hypothetical protein [Nodularia chucula]|uniref:hypothetical protein n=1 Tax=Nodularia chucula TaxID=3093667 RepID=UPI0039C63ABF
MKMQMLFSLGYCISLLATVTWPASALPILLQSTSKLLPAAVSEEITIPQDTAIIVSFPTSVTVDVGQDHEYPLTLPLNQAIADDQGNTIVPKNTPITITLKPTNGGVKIVAQSLVVDGRIVPIKASSQIIPGTTITYKRANDKAMENSAMWSQIAGDTLGFFSQGNPQQFDRGAMLGSIVGFLTGLSSAENIRVVQIPQSTIYVLSLDAPISLSPERSALE